MVTLHTARVERLAPGPERLEGGHRGSRGGRGFLEGDPVGLGEQGVRRGADVLGEATEPAPREVSEDGVSRLEVHAASDGLHLLQRVRDEAHRFAVSFHIKLRTKKGRRSILDEIPGIGPKRKRALIRKYGSVAKIRAAGVDELASLPGMTRATATALKEAL